MARRRFTWQVNLAADRAAILHLLVMRVRPGAWRLRIPAPPQRSGDPLGSSVGFERLLTRRSITCSGACGTNCPSCRSSGRCRRACASYSRISAIRTRRFRSFTSAAAPARARPAPIAASVLQAAGFRTGLYTSPHLQTFIERIAVDGRLIAPDAFADIVLGLDPLVRKMHIDVLDGIGFGRPSLVEVAFAAGMKHLADERCDAAVVEVGLGGRTDCTNVFDAAGLSPSSRTSTTSTASGSAPPSASIAATRRRIIKGGERSSRGTTRREALAVIDERCRERGATLLRLGREMRVRTTAADAEAAACSTCGRRSAPSRSCGCRLPARTRSRTLRSPSRLRWRSAARDGPCRWTNRGARRPRLRADERATGDGADVAPRAAGFRPQPRARRASWRRRCERTGYAAACGCTSSSACSADKDQPAMAAALASGRGPRRRDAAAARRAPGRPGAHARAVPARSRRTQRRLRGVARRGARPRALPRARRRTSSVSQARCSSSGRCASAGCRNGSWQTAAANAQ